MAFRKEGPDAARHSGPGEKRDVNTGPHITSAEKRQDTDRRIELTRFIKDGGLLTKVICLGADGRPQSDASDCLMTWGEAERVLIHSVQELADHLNSTKPMEGWALGVLRPSLPDIVRIRTKADIDAHKLNGVERPDVVARASGNIIYIENQPAYALLDSDTKGIPGDVAARIKQHGGLWPMLVELFPQLRGIAHVIRASTSAGLKRADTGEVFEGSGGVHIYIRLQDGADMRRFLQNLHERCWSNGLGWVMIGEGAQFLNRSPIDRMVYGPERLVFEGPPHLEPPLVQDTAARVAIAFDGEILDTRAAFPELTIAEKDELHRRVSRAKEDLAPELAKARKSFIDTRTPEMAKRLNISVERAKWILEQSCHHILLPGIVLPFDSREFEGCTVGDVLANPQRFSKATLADPLEGPAYGRSKAMLMVRADGSVWVRSFAHGYQAYELKWDFEAVKAAMEKAAESEAYRVLETMMFNAELGNDELEILKIKASERTKIGKRIIDAMVKAAQAKRLKWEKQQEEQRHAAERRDPRPVVELPRDDAPYLKVMAILNDVLGNSKSLRPPARNLEGFLIEACKQVIPNTHVYGTATDDKSPAPPQWAFMQLDETQTAELIERHIDFVHDGRSVHLQKDFVKHFMKRPDDRALPRIVSIATAPLILADGVVLVGEGLDRKRQIQFEIPDALRKALPCKKDCTKNRVRKAIEFLFDEWLCDVNADRVGKAILIAKALTMIERSLLDQRPSFFISAGKRGSGKTTTLSMIVMAVFGTMPAGSAWSKSAEERRKTLLALFLSGVGYIAWDNIERGEQLSCPHVERSLTLSSNSDRVLGVSLIATPDCKAIQSFNGNNIGPRGDLASRSLIVNLAVDRVDPENRNFAHTDIIGWTEDNRIKILQALYTILLGNPQLDKPRNAPMRTRFKRWWRLVGSAVEHAVSLLPKDDSNPEPLDFQKLFLEQEAESDEDSTSLVEFLKKLEILWPNGAVFDASDLAQEINQKDQLLVDPDLVEYLFPEGLKAPNVSVKAVGKRLRKVLNNPQQVGDPEDAKLDRKLVLTIGSWPAGLPGSSAAKAEPGQGLIRARGWKTTNQPMRNRTRADPRGVEKPQTNPCGGQAFDFVWHFF